MDVTMKNESTTTLQTLELIPVQAAAYLRVLQSRVSSIAMVAKQGDQGNGGDILGVTQTTAYAGHLPVLQLACKCWRGAQYTDAHARAVR